MGTQSLRGIRPQRKARMSAPSSPAAAPPRSATAWIIIFGVSLCHLCNDVLQSLLSALYPLLRDEFSLSFGQIGLLTFAFQITASLLQPVVGLVTDKHPFPRSLPLSSAASLAGILMLAWAQSYAMLFAGAMLIGLGSAIFHPEASRVSRMASGGRFGTAQSFFQVGGNFGTAIGPLLAAFIVVPFGRPTIGWFGLIALCAMVILWQIGSWYIRAMARNAGKKATRAVVKLSRRRVMTAIVILALLTFSKNFYTAGINSYYTFFLIERFDLTTQQSQMMLFLFLAAMAVGVMLGGPFGDRFGTLSVIWISILGVLPFTLMLPYADLFWTGVLSVIIGVLLASAFPAIVVYAQELVPGRVGLIAGIFFGFAFGMGGIGAAVLGEIADAKGIFFVYQLCSVLPAIGLLTLFLPRRSEISD